MEGEAETFWLTRALFQRSMGLLYLVAFLAALHQFCPLLGERGLLPVPQFLKYAKFSQAPSLFFLHYSDRFLRAVACAGIALSLLAATGLSERLGTLFSMAVWTALWVLYLSIVNVGQTFYAFGWESMLLEAGFFTIWFGAAKTASPAAVVWLLRWMLFRVMFGAGLIKLRGDPCWRDLTCLLYHYETQPIPNPLSWTFHHMPVWFHKLGVGVNHFVELVVPFGFFAPQPICAVAGILTILFHAFLIVSGNFSWLNYLTIILAFSCFSDCLLSRWLPLPAGALQPRAPVHEAALWAMVGAVALLSVEPIKNLVSRRQMMNYSFNPVHLVNTYGAFGSITRQRFEIIVEGTRETALTPDTRWQEYEFKAKPGSVSRGLPLVAPYHLRLDWLMWFAAMSDIRHHPWVYRLAEKLLQGDRGMLGLMARNPFPDAPPRFLRMRLYRYRFTSPEERKATGDWWSRTYVGEYLPPASLRLTDE